MRALLSLISTWFDIAIFYLQTIQITCTKILLIYRRRYHAFICAGTPNALFTKYLRTRTLMWLR